MSYLKINPDTALLAKELNKLVSFLDEKGWRESLLLNSKKFGVIKDEGFVNSKVQNGISGCISINAVSCIDKYGLVAFLKEPIVNLPVPNDGLWYWIKVKHKYSSLEEGVCALDSSGNLTGTNTKFTELLRGQPDFPSKISFPNALLNVFEYDVLEILNDENAILQGVFVAESDLRYSVVGTFTPGVNPPTASKYIYQYSDCEVELVKEVSENTPPSFVQDEEFYIARIKHDPFLTPLVIIQDKRELNIFETKAQSLLKEVMIIQNPLIGVEAVKYNQILSPLDKNVMYLAWTFRSSNFTLNSNENRITINNGGGGRFKGDLDFTTNFTNGDFNDWRLYTEDGKFFRIIDSVKDSGTIVLTLDNLLMDSFFNNDTSPKSQQLIISPNAEEIEIILSTDNTELPSLKKVFPINMEFGKVEVPVYKDPSCLWNLKYRYKTLNDYSSVFVFLSDPAGYYDENQFDDNGVFIAEPTRTPYTAHSTNGFIELKLKNTAYSNVILGDLEGVEVVSDLHDGNKILQIGVSKQYQYFNTAVSVTLTENRTIKLKNGIKNGNIWYLHFRQNINLSTYSLTIIDENDVVLYTITSYDVTNMALPNPFGVLMQFKWDGTSWVLFGFANQFTQNAFTFILNNYYSLIQANAAKIANIEAAWVTEALDGSYFTLTGCTITPTNGRWRYKTIGKTMFVSFYAELEFSGSASDTDMLISLPDSKSIHSEFKVNELVDLGSAADYTFKIRSYSSDLSKLSIRRAGSHGLFPTPPDATILRFNLTLEIQ